MTVDELLQSKWGVKFSISDSILRDGVLSLHRPQYIGLAIDEDTKIEEIGEHLEIRTKSASVTLYVNGLTHTVII